jgi:hypothetical protein
VVPTVFTVQTISLNKLAIDNEKQLDKRMADDPVYLIASERSGTNLLRKRLTDCQDYYYGPTAAQLLKHLYYREPFYGDLGDNDNFRQLIADALDLCYVHFAPWDIQFTPQGVLDDYGDRRRSAIDLSDYLMTQYSISKGYTSYFCKDNFIYEFALDISLQIPSAKFVYLYRDPRDFVLSQTKRPNASRSPIEHARLWDFEQVKAIRVARHLERQGRCIFVSYEELIQDESRVLGAICNFIGVQKRDKASRSKDNIVDNVQEWKNLHGETLKNNSGKFERELSSRAVAKIEMTCLGTMKYLGYSRVTTRSAEIGFLERAWDYLWFNLLKLLAQPSAERLPAVVARTKLLKRFRVNYRYPR